MNRTEDTDENTVTFSIPSFSFTALVTVDEARVDTYRVVEIQDVGGIVARQGAPVVEAEERAKQMLWSFYRGSEVV